MPTISQFYGITIKIHFNEHEPPHIHVSHDEHDAAVSIESGALLNGSLKPRAEKLVKEWIELHREELLKIWQTGEFVRIQPLE